MNRQIFKRDIVILKEELRKIFDQNPKLSILVPIHVMSKCLVEMSNELNKEDYD